MLESLQSEGAYAIIVSNSAEIALFGVYTVFFACALLLLIAFKRPLPVDWSMVAAACVMYMVCMAHVSFTTTDRHTAFTSGFPLPPPSDLSGILRVSDIILKTAGFLSQLLMIHRCWAVWDFKLSVVIVPLVMATTAMVLAVVGPARLTTAQFTSIFVMPRDVVFDAPWSIMSLLVYILVTSLIFVRLKWISTYFRNFKSIEALITSLIGACIETGVVLVLVQLILVVFLILDHPAVILVESIAAQTYGIAPTTMIIRLGLSLIPRNRLRQYNTTTAPQFSTLLIDTIYPHDEHNDDIELEETPIDTTNLTRRSPDPEYGKPA